MATHSSILAWKIPSTEELGGLQSMGLQKVRHNWVTKHVRVHTHTHVYICTQTPIFFICSYVDGNLGVSISWLMKTILLWTWGTMYHFELVLLIFPNTCTGMELLVNSSSILENEMATHSSIHALKIPWMEEPVGYSPWGRKESDTTERLYFSSYY